MADYFVIASGTSNTHIKAIADGLLVDGKQRGLKKDRVEGYREAHWVLVDFGDIVVHIFAPEERSLLRYRVPLERDRTYCRGEAFAGQVRRRRLAMADQNADDVRKQAEYERLMHLAHVNRMRGDYAQAAVQIKQALELRPDDLDAREFAADILFARGELEKAAEHYKAIHEADPSRASAEEKFAKATLQIAEGKRQKDLLRMMIEDPTAFRSQYQPPPRRPVVAAILSGIPGLGHVYCGQLVKGIVIFAGSALCWLLFFALARMSAIFLPTSASGCS